MKAVIIAKRDLSAFLMSYSGYFILASVLFVNGILFQHFAMGSTARYSHEVLEGFFYYNGGMSIIAAIFLTMRTLAEEQAQGTDQLLRGSILSDSDVVVGKYLSVMTMLLILALLSTYLPAMIFVNGKVSLTHIAVGYLGVLAISSAVAAIGVFASSLFRSQMAAAIVSSVIVVVFITAWILAQITDPPFSDIASYSAIWDKHFEPFKEGRLLTQSLVYLGSITCFFLFLASQTLDERRWE